MSLKSLRGAAGIFLNFGESSTDSKQEPLLRMTTVLPLPDFQITRLLSVFNLHNDSKSSLIKLKGGLLCLSKFYHVNVILY